MHEQRLRSTTAWLPVSPPSLFIIESRKESNAINDKFNAYSFKYVVLRKSSLLSTKIA